MFRQVLQRWKHRRAEASAERARVQRLFSTFLQETKPLVPRAPKYPEAALLRHAWKRAVVLEIIYQRRAEEGGAQLYSRFQELAADQYYRIAPSGPYGTVQLTMCPKAAVQLLQSEIERLSRPGRSREKERPLACIYVGICEEGRVYVGQTVDAPEKRWIQHRAESTGPFKRGARYVQWKVIEGGVNPRQLAERESFYIGFYDAYANGYNDTRGNDWAAHERGRSAKERQ